MKRTGHPRIPISLERMDWLMEAIGLIGILLLIGVPFIYYGQLPDSVPTHFGMDGQPDAFGDKKSIWILPGIGILTYFGLQLLSRHPHLFNYPVEITKENAARQYQIGARLMRTVNAIITCFLAYLVYASIQTALGRRDGIELYAGILITLLIVGISIYFIRAHRREA